MKKNTETTAPIQEEFKLKDLKNALLVGIFSSGGDRGHCADNLLELARLCDTFGLSVAESISCSLKRPDAGTYLGKGKIEELRQKAVEIGAEVIIFDEEISPHQQKNLEALFKKPVLDRTELIIEVFAQRAQTKEARLQVELAKIKYQFPRLKRLWTHLSRQSSGGGGFVKGEGEQQIEIDRRLLRKRIERLKEEIEEVVAHRQTQRTARKRSAVPTFSLVGYTNAGKSTLLNALTQSDVLAEDKLFATLDTTTRKCTLPNNQEVLVIDTVGFIRKIPHTLVAAFKSTLEEVVHTDILIHLIDVSHPQAELQAAETCRVLKELGAASRPVITVLNKTDVCTCPGVLSKFKLSYSKTVKISALTGEGLEDLKELMIEEIAKLRTVVKLKIPQSRYALIAELMQDGKILESEYEENDILLTMEIQAKDEYKVKEFLIK